MRKYLLVGVLGLFAVTVLLLAAGLGTPEAIATPNLGNDCAKCHGVPNPTAPPGKEPAAPPAPKATSPSQPASAPAAPVASAQPKVSSVKLTIEGQTKTILGTVMSQRTLVAARELGNLLGAQVSWDAASSSVTLQKGAHSITLTVGQKTAQSNGKKIPTNIAPRLIGNKAYVPVRETATALGYTVAYDAQKGVVLTAAGAAPGPTGHPAPAAPASGGSISEQWAASGHNKANWGELTPDSPVNRDNCIACHDGQGFANAKTKRAELPEAVRNTPNSIDCNACHSDRGQQIMASGSTPPLAAGYQVSGAGAGALCITCHNGRKLPDPANTPAPHRGPQADVLFGWGGVTVAGVTYPTSPHGANPDTCATCHVANNGGVPNHTFRVIDTPEYVKATCGSCHEGLTTVNRTALGDYDGDRKIEGIQDEVEGLLELLESAIEAKEAELGVHGGESHGSFHWTDAAGQDVKVSEALYKARWNYALVENDGSLGIHNPAYVISLLQKSYKELTDQDVPNATLR